MRRAMDVLGPSRARTEQTWKKASGQSTANVERQYKTRARLDGSAHRSQSVNLQSRKSADNPICLCGTSSNYTVLFLRKSRSIYVRRHKRICRGDDRIRYSSLQKSQQTCEQDFAAPELFSRHKSESRERAFCSLWITNKAADLAGPYGTELRSRSMHQRLPGFRGGKRRSRQARIGNF